MSIEVLEPGQRSLRELADEANREHSLAMESGVAMVEHAIRAGHALLQAQNRCPKREWEAWISQNWHASRTTASIYMRFADREEDLRDGGITGIKEGQRYLKMLGGASRISGVQHGWRKEPPAWVTGEARELRAKGMSFKAISREIGVPYSTVLYWVNPGLRERDRERARQRNVELAKLRKQAEERRARQVIRKAGAAEQELYAMAERMQDIMGQAHREATDSAKRKHYALAGEHYRKMRDEIVRALGVA